MVTVLIVEDDRNARLLAKTELKSTYRVLEAEDGEDALTLLEHEKADLIVLDVQMPRMDGYEFLRQLRGAGDTTPVIMLTAMDTFAHKREGFAVGADDYMTKPVNYEELRWRISALLRRANIATEKALTIGGLTMDQNRYTAQLNGVDISLTNKEFDLLFKLLSYPGVVFTKQQLLDDVWGYDTETEYDTIKTYMSKLRNKLSDCPEIKLVALRGIGYKAVIEEGQQEDTRA